MGSENMTTVIMRKKQPTSSLTDVLKKAVVDSGSPLLQISKGSGLEYASLFRFMSGERSLRLDKADKLAAYFGLQLQANEPKSKG